MAVTLNRTASCEPDYERRRGQRRAAFWAQVEAAGGDDAGRAAIAACTDAAEGRMRVVPSDGDGADSAWSETRAILLGDGDLRREVVLGDLRDLARDALGTLSPGAKLAAWAFIDHRAFSATSDVWDSDGPTPEDPLTAWHGSADELLDAIVRALVGRCVAPQASG